LVAPQFLFSMPQMQWKSNLFLGTCTSGESELLESIELTVLFVVTGG